MMLRPGNLQQIEVHLPQDSESFAIEEHVTDNCPAHCVDLPIAP